MPPKKKKPKKTSPAQVDVETGGWPCWPKPSSKDDGVIAYEAGLGHKVKCGDFGDPWQIGTVTKAGRQHPPDSDHFTQVERDERPKVRPDAWGPSSADATDGGGYTWDVITSENADQREESRMNGAKHLWVAYSVMAAILAWGFLDLAENVMRIIEIMGNPDESITAFDLAKLGNDTISVILCLLVYLLWATMCFKFRHIRRIWSLKPWIFNSQSMMPGGFIPRPSAVSLGLLMFISSVFISERVAGGAALVTRNADGSYKNNVGHGEWCRADVREETHYQDDWFSRFGRLNPSGCFMGTCPPNSMIPGCNQTGTPLSPLLFNTALNASGMPHPNLVSPYQRTSHISLTIYQGLQSVFPSLFGHTHPDDSVIMDEGHTCIYQCVKWRAYGFNDIVTKVGSIGAGNAIVTKMTESATSWLGKQTITADTSAEDLRGLLDSAKPGTSLAYRFFHKSAAVPAIILAFLRVFLSFFVYKIDDHGFFTVDYYVSQVLLFAISASIICRKYNMFRWEHVLYCGGLWSAGAEDFVIPDSVDGDVTASRPRSVDLLVWLHMSFEERAYLLIHFARKVSQNDKKALHAEVQCFMEVSQEVSVLGSARTKESRNVLIKRAQLDDKWPEGQIIKMKGGRAHVQWKNDHICADVADGDDDPQWLEKLKTAAVAPMASEKDCERFRQATTTEVDPLLLFDMSADWDDLLYTYVGSTPEAVDAVRGKILWRILRNIEDQPSPSPTTKKKDALVKPASAASVAAAAEDKQKKKAASEEATKKKEEKHFNNHRNSVLAPNCASDSNAKTPLLKGTH